MRGGGWGGGGGMNGGSRGRGDGGGSWRGGGGGGGSWRGGGGGGGGGKAYFGSRGGRSSGRRGGYRGRGGRSGADGGGGRGGPPGGSDLPTQCLPGLEGQCHRGASCWYVHAVSYATNSVEPSAHQGAVVSLANDAKNLYSFGVDGVVRTFEWSPQAGFTSSKKQPILGVGTMFAVSEPTKQMYMMGTSCPILPGLSHEASCSVGRVQVHYGSTAMDLSISPDERPYTDGVKVTQAVAFENPDAGTGQPNPIIFTAGGDGVIRRWQFDQASNRFAVVATLEGHTREITGLVLHTDQQAMLFSSSLDGTVRGWSATTNTLEWIATGLGTYRRFTEGPMTEGSMGPGHQEGVTSIVKLAYEGAYYLATTGSDGSLRMWNLQGQCLGAGPSVDFRTGPALTLEQVMFNDNSSVLVVAYQNGVIIWSIPTLEVCVVIGGTSPGPQGPPRNHVTALLSPAPGIYVTGSSDGAVKVWNIAQPTDA